MGVLKGLYYGVVALSILPLFLCGKRAEAVTNLTAWQQGIATNYGGSSDGMSPDQPSFGTMDGSCGYGMLDKSSWPYWSVGALSISSQFFADGPIEACGQCFEVQCLNQGGAFQGRCNTNNPVSVIVQITDKCPECAANQLDIQALTFNKLAPMANGRIDIQYRRVECVPPAPMVVFVDNNNGPGGWLRLFVEQSGGQAAISSVQVRTSSSTAAWQSLNNVYGSDWETPRSPSYPLDVSIIGPSGETVTAFNVINATGQLGDFPTSAQFHITNPTDNLLSYPVGTSTGNGPPVGANDNNGSAVGTNGSNGPPVGISGNTNSITGANGTLGSPTAASRNNGSAPMPPTQGPPPASPSSQQPAPSKPSTQTGTDSASGQTTPSAPPLLPPPTFNASPTIPTPPPPPQAVAGNQNPCGSCFDHRTPVFSCAQQVGWGQCQQPWMLAGDQTAPEGFCALSCGRCTCP